VPAAEVERILSGLGFAVEPLGGGVWRVGVPSWRWYDFPLLPRELWGAAGENADEQDLFEEVLRHFGFDKIPATLPAVPGVDEGTSPEHDRRERIRRHLAAAGFAEAINYAFQPAAAEASLPALERRGAPETLASPPSEQFAVLRRSLLPGLVESASTNQRRGAPGVRLFELGHVFPGGGAPEVETAALVAGGVLGTPWERRIELDLFDLKGAVESLAADLGVELAAVPAEIPGLLPGASAELRRGGEGERIGLLGQLAGGDFPFPVFVAELETAALAGPPHGGRVEIPSRFPGIAADLTFTHALDVAWQEIAAFVRAQRVSDLVDFGLEVRYRGEGVPPGAVNTTIHFLYQAADRSLTQEEVNQRHLALAEELRRRFGRQGDGA
jgi:phenylalanyl-tRNA synthetase beta chain